ncbi:MAG: hypothetical protein M3R38_13295 [Actinomycetota bacterium]|nr:hypothetical protein [Actinomycetota bacterium]
MSRAINENTVKGNAPRRAVAVPPEYRGASGEDLRDLPLNRPEDHDALGLEERAVLRAWIAANMGPAKTPDPYRTSYGLKHRFEESEGGFYTTNGQFKGAMLAAGYEPEGPEDLNWRFRARLREHGGLGDATDGR